VQVKNQGVLILDTTTTKCPVVLISKCSLLYYSVLVIKKLLHDGAYLDWRLLTSILPGLTSGAYVNECPGFEQIFEASWLQMFYPTFEMVFPMHF